MTTTDDRTDQLADRYLELLRESIGGLLTAEHDIRVPIARPTNAVKAKVIDAMRERGLVVTRKAEPPAERYTEGQWWPYSIAPEAYSMAGEKRLIDIQHCVQDVVAHNVPGDLAETGVWRGGSSILMKGVLAAYGVTDRKVVVCDSFQGLPQDSDVPIDAGVDVDIPWLAVSQEQVAANFERFGLLDDQVEFVKGWFDDTLPSLTGRTWAVLRLDGDLYSSTMVALTSLYDGLSVGGWIVIDDYGALEACRTAVHDFRDSRGITEPIQTIDWTGVKWRRER